MPELLLHVGWPKTGTSSMQAMLRTHPNLAGKPYDRSGGDRARPIRHHLLREHPFDAERVSRHWSSSRSDPDVPVIYSDEGCVSMPPHHWHSGFLAPETVAARLAEAASGWDVRILLSARDGLGLLRSSYRHAVRNGYSRSYDDYIARIAAEVDREEGVFAAGMILDTYRRLFGSAHVAVVHMQQLVAGDLWRAAGQALGLPSLEALGGEAPHENRHELGPIHAEVFVNRWLLASKFHPKRGLRRVRAPWFRDHASGRIPGWTSSTGFEGHDVQVEAAIADRFDDETRAAVTG